VLSNVWRWTSVENLVAIAEPQVIHLEQREPKIQFSIRLFSLKLNNIANKMFFFSRN